MRLCISEDCLILTDCAKLRVNHALPANERVRCETVHPDVYAEERHRRRRRVRQSAGRRHIRQSNEDDALYIKHHTHRSLSRNGAITYCRCRYSKKVDVIRLNRLFGCSQGGWSMQYEDLRVNELQRQLSGTVDDSLSYTPEY